MDALSTQWMFTYSLKSPESCFPHGIWKSLLSLKACRNASIVSGVIWTIKPSDEKNECRIITKWTRNRLLLWTETEQPQRHNVKGVEYLGNVMFYRQHGIQVNFKKLEAPRIVYLRNSSTDLLPSTMLDLAINPDEAFRAPLKTTKLAPVTETNRMPSLEQQSYFKQTPKI